jgi:hypothetical protein
VFDTIRMRLVKFRGVSVPVLFGVMFALTPLAFASPPDQTWLGGFYDDADYDDVVVLVTTGTLATEVHVHYDGPCRYLVVDRLVESSETSVRNPATATHQTRAPPSSS